MPSTPSPPSPATTAPAVAPVEVHRSATPTGPDERGRILADPGFGRHLGDHVALADWSAGSGWTAGRVEPRHDPTMALSSSVLHYGQSVFDGLKAFRRPDGEVALFRPEASARRLVYSARRMALPEPPVELTLALLDALVDADRDWVPEDPESSLYLRPVLFATETTMGVHPSDSARLAVLCSPSGPYFPGGLRACSLLVEREIVRAAPGGTGAAKCAGNYAAGMRAQIEARAQGCDQVLFLDAAEHRYLDECGSMNILVARADGTVSTPPLNGCILPGITRDSLLTAGESWGVPVREEAIDVDELLDDIDSGAVTEVFACGTAAVVTPVGALHDRGRVHRVGDGRPGPLALRLRAGLTDVQRGRAEDRWGWNHLVPRTGSLGAGATGASATMGA